MSYKIKNLRDVEDSAPKFGFDEHQEAHFASGDLETDATGVAYHVVKPGQRQGFAHRHDEVEEVYVVLSGSGRIKLDDRVEDIGPRDAIRVAATVARSFEAGDEGLEIIAFGPRNTDDRGEMITEDFWGDA